MGRRQLRRTAYRTAKGTDFRAAHERHARLRAHRGDRVGRRRADLRHRGRGPPQLRGRRLRRAQQRGRLPQEPGRPRGARASSSRAWTRRSSTTRTSSSEHLGTVIPPGDNKFAALELRGVVGRQLHLRPAGRARGHAAAGVLPHQRGERGPVRAHADHRGRGFVGALRRGLLGAGVLERLAALRGRRADREAERADPVHHDPELVAERLQPRHQAGAGRDRGDRRVDRRQPRARSSR